MFLRVILTSFLLLMMSTSVKAVNDSLITPYIQDPTVSLVRVSPDGKHVAMMRQHEDFNHSIITLRTSDLKLAGTIGFGGKVQPLDFTWGNNSRLVMRVGERKSGHKQIVNYGEVFSANIDGGRGNTIFGVRAVEERATRLKKKESIKGWADTVVSILPSDDQHILLSYTPYSRDGGLSKKIVKLNIYDGRVYETIGGPKLVDTYFLTDGEHQLRYAWGSSEFGVYELHKYDNEDWIKLDTDAIPVAINNDGFIALDEANDGRQAMYRYSHDGKRLKGIYKHKHVDITNVIVSSDKTSAYAARVDDGYPGYAIVDKEHSEGALFSAMVQQFAGQHVSIVSTSLDGSIAVVHTSSDFDKGSYYLYNKTTGQLSYFVGWLNDAKPPVKTYVEPIKFASFDDLIIDGYITDAEVKSPKPLVVMVHGGPHGVRDYWGYNSTVQILAANGYRVLQVNYRGSGGYGLKFMTDGYRQWGAAVQQDIIAGTQWAIDQNYASADNVCIMGWSFGAYSALQSSALNPELYQCAVGGAGVYDLPLMHKKGDITKWIQGEDYLEEALGNDLAELTRYSPTHNAANLKANILLIHGTKDERTPIAQAKAMRKALDKAGIAHKYVELKGEGHGIFDSENRLKHYQMLIEFLDKNLKKAS